MTVGRGGRRGGPPRRARQPANSAPGQQPRPGFSKDGVKLIVNENQIKGAVNHAKVQLAKIFKRLSKVEGQANHNSHNITKLFGRTQKASNAATNAMNKVRNSNNKPDKTKKPPNPEKKYQNSRVDMKLMNDMKKAFVENAKMTDEVEKKAKDMFKAKLNLVYTEFVKAGLRPRKDPPPGKEEAASYKHEIVGFFDENDEYVVEIEDENKRSKLGQACDVWARSRFSEDFNNCKNQVAEKFGDVEDQATREKNMVEDPTSKKKVDPLLVFYNLVFLMGALHGMWKRRDAFEIPKQIEVFEEVAEETTDEASDSEKGPGGDLPNAGEGSEEGSDFSVADPDETPDPDLNDPARPLRDERGKEKDGESALEDEPAKSRFMGSQLRQLQARLSQL